MNEQVIFYALTSSEKDGLFYRYIGFTRRDPNERYREHLADKRETSKTEWLQRCLWNDVPIALEILDALHNPTDEEIIARERELIEEYKAYASLVNSTKGGEGVKRRLKLITQSDRECLICSTFFFGERVYCSPKCRQYARKVAAIPKPEFRGTLFLGQHCQPDCMCSECEGYREEARRMSGYTNPRSLNLFSRERIPLLDDKL